jgi:ABC-type microcin C transport system duplicated ATPase subunit YejF
MSGKRYPEEFKLKQSNRLLIAVILFPALQHVSISPPTAFTLDKEVRYGLIQ